MSISILILLVILASILAHKGRSEKQADVDTSAPTYDEVKAALGLDGDEGVQLTAVRNDAPTMARLWAWYAAASAEHAWACAVPAAQRQVPALANVIVKAWQAAYGPRKAKSASLDRTGAIFRLVKGADAGKALEAAYDLDADKCIDDIRADAAALRADLDALLALSDKGVEVEIRRKLEAIADDAGANGKNASRIATIEALLARHADRVK